MPASPAAASMPLVPADERSPAELVEGLPAIEVVPAQSLVVTVWMSPLLQAPAMPLRHAQVMMN
jgi:hypothetical protein